MRGGCQLPLAGDLPYVINSRGPGLNTGANLLNGGQTGGCFGWGWSLRRDSNSGPLPYQRGAEAWRIQADLNSGADFSTTPLAYEERVRPDCNRDSHGPFCAESLKGLDEVPRRLGRQCPSATGY